LAALESGAQSKAVIDRIRALKAGEDQLRIDIEAARSAFVQAAPGKDSFSRSTLPHIPAAGGIAAGTSSISSSMQRRRWLYPKQTRLSVALPYTFWMEESPSATATSRFRRSANSGYRNDHHGVVYLV
jgi:hypothetical protein